MIVKRSIKSVLLAAASLSAAGVVASAHAEEAAPQAAPTPVIETVVGADEAAVAAPAENGGWAGKLGVLAAVAVGAFAGLARFKGVKRLAEAVGEAAPHVVNAAGVAARSSAKAIRSAGAKVGGWVGGPLRRIAVFAGLCLAGVAGVGFYNIEWAGGMLVGGGLVIAAWRSSARVKRLLSPPPPAPSEG